MAAVGFPQHNFGPYLQGPAPGPLTQKQQRQHQRNILAFCRAHRDETLNLDAEAIEVLYAEYMQRQRAIAAAKELETIHKCVIQPIQKYPTNTACDSEHWMHTG